MLKSKGLHFDMVICKPKSVAAWTLEFKLTVLDSLLPPNTSIEEVVIYEDRPKHVDAFREYLAKRTSPNDISDGIVNSIPAVEKGTRILKGEVVFVELERYYLDANVEDALVLDMMRQNPVKEKRNSSDGICEAELFDEANETVYAAENVPPATD
jgi:hypothetical protein